MVCKDRPYVQGEYNVKNPQKYIGKKNPYYKSSYELRFFHFCDDNKNVLKWGYEVIEIDYFFKQLNEAVARPRKYYPDIYLEMMNDKGEVEKWVIEIKPEDLTREPKKPKRNTQKARNNYLLKYEEYAKNIAKWEVCEKFCRHRGIRFKVMTESSIF